MLTNPSVVLMLCMALEFPTAAGHRLPGQIGVRSREEVKDRSKSKRTTAKHQTRVPASITLSTNPPASCQLKVTPATQPQTAFHYDLSTAAIAHLIPGKYLIETQCQGYEAGSMSVELPHDAPQGLLMIRLVPLTIETILKTIPAGVTVSLDGQSLGVSGPDGVLRLPTPKAGRYQLFVSKQGYKSRFTEIDVQTTPYTLTLELTKDELISRYESLAAALKRGELDQALDLYEQLVSDQFDPALLAGAMSKLLDELDLRSLKLLQSVGPYGLVLSKAELETMHRLYRRTQPLAAKTVLLVDRRFTILSAYWELRWEFNDQAGQLPGSERVKEPRVQATLDQLMTLSPMDGFLWYDVGWICLSLGDNVAARRAFERARDARPEWAYPYFGLATIETEESYHLKNKAELRAGLQSAGAKFEEAIKRNNDFLLAYVSGAFSYADAAQAPKALALAQQAAAKAPNSGHVKYALGYAHFAAGRKHYGMARAFLQEALSAKSDQLDAERTARVIEILKEIDRKR